MVLRGAVALSDIKGDHDNTLVKGDVATRGDKDNPKSGTVISVSAYKKDTKTFFTKEITKNDNEALPNAIPDMENRSRVLGIYMGFNFIN